MDSLTSRLETSPSRWDKELDTGSSYRSSRYDTSGSSRLERTSKYASLEDSGTTSRLERASRYSVAEDSSASKYDRSSRYSITDDSGSRYQSRTSRYSVAEAGDSDISPSRYTSKYITESSDADISPYTRRESRTSSRYLTEASDLDTGSSRYERSSRLTRGTSELSETGSTKWERPSSRSYAIDSEQPSSVDRYEQRLLAELELDTKPSRWDRTSSRYAIESPDHDTDYSRLDRRTSRLTSVTSESDEQSKYDRTSRYVSDLDSGPSKWESEYASQFNRKDVSSSSRLDRQSSRLSTDSTELDTGLSRYGTSRIDRQSSRSSDIDIDSSYKRSSKLETIQSYGVIGEPAEDESVSNLVRTSSGIIRATVKRESEPDIEALKPSKPQVKKTIKSVTQTGNKFVFGVKT